MQTLQDGLAALGRQLLPAREQRLANLPLLLGSQLFPHLLPVAQVLLLRWSQPIPGLKALANLRLLFRRQILEALIVLQKFLLPVRRHILEPLDGLRRQIVQVSRARRVPGVDTRAHGIGGFRLQLLLTSQLALLAALLCRCLRNLAESLRGCRGTEQARRQKDSQNSTELESQPHYLVSFVTSPGAAVAEDGSSESASNLESTS